MCLWLHSSFQPLHYLSELLWEQSAWYKTNRLKLKREEFKMVENKVVIITGSARGIGFEIGKHLLKKGRKLSF